MSGVVLEVFVGFVVFAVLGIIALVCGLAIQAMFLGNELDVKIRMWEICAGNPFFYRLMYMTVFPRHVSSNLSLDSFPKVQPWNWKYSCTYLFNQELPWLVSYKPLIRSELERAGLKSHKLPVLRNVNQHTTCIHLRLGDVPFTRQRTYPLYRFTAYVQLVQQIHKQLPSTVKQHNVIIIFTTKSLRHAKERAYISTSIANALAERLHHFNPLLNITLRSDQSLKDDMDLMDDCESLIGLVGSFIFYLGIVKKNGCFYSSQKAITQQMKYVDVKSFRINHSEVPDYYNEADVLSRLLV